MIEDFIGGGSDLNRKLNDLARTVNALDNMTGDGFVQVNKTLAGTSITLNIPKVLERMPTFGGSGSGTAAWAVIIEMPSYPDPMASQDSEAYLGRGWYTVRLVGSTLNVWNVATAYLADAIVVYPEDSALSYKAKRNNLNAVPDTSPDDWEQMEDIRIQYAIGAEATDDDTARDIRNCVPWFTVGQIIPLVSRTVNSSTRYYIKQTLAFTGEPEDSSIRFDDVRKITQAVFS